ncbi:MAG: phosphatidate cytidylyltransferase [Bacteroidales bacterium]|jgi:phosphatidate cytidylyltransferase|nr:phosphatidate cytidylyltransferase [Bacteroidales bacterium]
MNNTVVRTLSGLVFLLIMVGSLLIGPIAYAAVMLFIIAVVMHEYLEISLGRKYRIPRLLAILTGLSLFLILFFILEYNIEVKMLLIALVPLVATYISLIWEKDAESYRKNQYLGGSVLYTALPFALTTLIVYKENGEFDGTTLLFFFIILWVSDIGAYVFGMLFGQKNGHKLFPSISPKKSWEGFYGGLGSALVFAVIIYYSGLSDFNLMHTLIVALIINIASVLGDLAESQFKRNFGVKDSGSLMPGHGGLLDRFDGALTSFPLAIAYIKLLSLF